MSGEIELDERPLLNREADINDNVVRSRRSRQQERPTNQSIGHYEEDQAFYHGSSHSLNELNELHELHERDELDELNELNDMNSTIGSEKGSVGSVVENQEISKAEEKAYVRKIDWNLLSFVSVLYLLSFLDRGNIGNANTAGMSDELGMSDDQYQWLLTIFYISYISFQWLSICWKAFPARYYAPLVVLGWGTLSACSAAVQNWTQLMVIRFLMGVFEAGYTGIPYYLSFFYLRHELGARVGVWLSVSPLASAFAGALAYGITLHEVTIENWRLLFLVEGLPSILCGIIAFWVIPNDAASSRFFTPRQRQIAKIRAVRQTGSVDHGGHTVEFGEIVSAFVDPKSWIPALMYFSVNVSYSALPVFLPSILKGMGYTSIQAQGLSAPPYIVTFVVLICVTQLSDRIKQRGLLIVAMAAVGAAGNLILALSQGTAVRYFAVFLAASGMFTCVPLIIVWLNNNNANESRRGAGFTLMQMIGQCGPLLGTRLFPESQAPAYTKGFFITFAFLCLLAALALTLRTYLARQNSHLDEQYSQVDETETEQFRYIL